MKVQYVAGLTRIRESRSFRFLVCIAGARYFTRSIAPDQYQRSDIVRGDVLRRDLWERMSLPYQILEWGYTGVTEYKYLECLQEITSPPLTMFLRHFCVSFAVFIMAVAAAVSFFCHHLSGF